MHAVIQVIFGAMEFELQVLLLGCSFHLQTCDAQVLLSIDPQKVAGMSSWP